MPATNKENARYGRFHIPGSNSLNPRQKSQPLNPSRASYILFVNSKIGYNDLVLHHCAVMTCVNPLHLHLGGHLENVLDRQAHGRSRNRFSPELTKQVPWAGQDFLDFLEKRLANEEDFVRAATSLKRTLDEIGLSL
jgi:hypothetical protein